MLKALFRYLYVNKFDHVWLTLFPKHEALIDLLEEFGFRNRSDLEASSGEMTMVKQLTPIASAVFDPYQLHKRFGPPAVDLMGSRVFVIPIQPHYHRMLFPEYERWYGRERELALHVPQPPFANGLRKAYLSQSRAHPLPRGATMLLYRSSDTRGITAVGVTESAIRSHDPLEIAQFTALRTVYSFEEILAGC